ncbi:GntR family transcriptional regulator [Actibacterium lipolyticum]|uniref:Putative HTH-type transcriptional regulator YdfH n=1 Tax=Actibacterium lipolyticum TaxID=1524263 RepID=A0A238KIF7_9RHOB|nr:GntR family transcriptional regulator [Actibacterium lipolyticum]SMX42457.1 putative HTH-type transcriptional regulator YdfH [Actibacterium lipolyticum]
MADPKNKNAEPRHGHGVYDRLLDDIRTGALGPGDRLLETELAERLNISRTPVREALRQLEADGLVTHVPRVGAAIRSLDYSEVMELYEMRAVLESTAARMAARAASDIEIAELEEINAELATATNDANRAYELNRQFHRTLLDAAKNRFLVKSTNALQKTLLILGTSTLAEVSRAEEAVAEHATILKALRARDGAAAEAAMRQHMESSHRVRLRQLRTRPDDETGA